MSLLKNREEAEDAAQEVYIKFSETISKFAHNCSYKTWLLTITRNFCFNRLAAKKFTGTEIESLAIADNRAVDQDAILTIQTALSTLTPDENELIYLKEFEGWSYKELAEFTNQTVENVKIKLFRARKKLREFISDEGYHETF
jgi:RNA polymerase sigma-70 factor (ECF subfamily)